MGLVMLYTGWLMLIAGLLTATVIVLRELVLWWRRRN